MKKNVRSVMCLCMAVMLTLTSCNTAGEASNQKGEFSQKDDFYAAVNAEWLSSAEIPGDKPTIDNFNTLSNKIEAVLMDDFGKILRGESELDNDELQDFIEFYRLAADYETRDALGAEPLLPYIEMVENLSSLKDLSNQWAAWDLKGMPAPFVTTVKADMKNSDMNALYISEPSLFFLDKSFYEDKKIMKVMQSVYSKMSVNLLKMAGKTKKEASQIVKQALAFDASLAPYTRSTEELSDYTKEYNPTDFTAFDAQIKGFDFTLSFGELLGEVPETIISANPLYFSVLDELVNEDTFENMKSWMLLKTVQNFAPFLSNEFRVESESFTQILSGVKESTEPEKAAYYLAAGTFDEVVGKYYGETYFGEQAKQEVTDMVNVIIDTYKKRMSDNTWLSGDTRAMAVKKLDNMKINVGYPEKIDSKFNLMQTVSTYDGGTLVGNMIEFTRLQKTDAYSKWNTPVERGLWPLSADKVNAMYLALDNSINFPAAILQAPFYSQEQSISVNYGGIGAVIAHEISHAFDPNGAKYDETGSLVDWWTAKDYEKFEELSKAMIEEFDGISYSGGTVNGTMTAAENIADAGGLSCALEAVKTIEDVDLEAFFTSWAVIWRQKSLPEYEKLLLTLEVHAPTKLRANIQLQNLGEFYSSFDIQEGDGMYRAPWERVNIW